MRKCSRAISTSNSAVTHRLSGPWKPLFHISEKNARSLEQYSAGTAFLPKQALCLAWNSRSSAKFVALFAAFWKAAVLSQAIQFCMYRGYAETSIMADRRINTDLKIIRG